MKQIYDFNSENPPVLNENMIRNEVERRRLQWQTAAVALAGILMGVVIVMFGCLVYTEYPAVAIMCFAYVIISATGGAIIAVICSRKRGLLL